MSKFIFRGLKNDFPRFLEAIFAEIQRSEYADMIEDYLDVTKFINAQGVEEIPPRYRKKDPPDLPASQTQPNILNYTLEMQVTEQHNNRVRGMLAKAMEAILNHVDDHI